MKDSPAGLLLAACLLCAVVAMIALVRAADWTRAHWVLVAFLAFVLLGLAMVLWERRRADHWREQEVDAEVGQWGRVYLFRKWPKKCLFCAMPVYNWHDAELHAQADSSACAAFLQHLEDQESEQARTAQQVEVDVLNTPGRGWPAVLPDQEEE